MSAEAKTEATEAKPKGGKPPMMIVIILVLVMNVLIVGKVFMGGGGGHAKDKEGDKKEHKEKVEVGKKVVLEEFLLNLADNVHYLKATVGLGLKKEIDEKKVEEETAPIRDAIVHVISAKKLSEIASTAGKEKLKEQLVEKINEEIGEDWVVKIYFTNFASQ